MTTARLTLRIAGPDDAPSCVQFNRDNAEFLAPWEPPMTRGALDVETMRAVRERAVGLARAGTGYSFAVFIGDGTDERIPIVGWVEFTNIVRGVFQACYLGYKIDRRMQRHGYMTEAVHAGIDYVFGTLRLHRIMANYMPHNQRSAQLLRRLGFAVEGSAKSYLYIGGQWRDHVLTSLVNPQPLVPPGYEPADA